ncbi:MAG: DUF2497 domain-containing protein [Pseudomonadota bacterium]|jgi:hypothetical protein|nr:DUF2497 domain-containing protein [Pseudomonadota bacterium]
MANEAHKEPTMEEILASIRKIISDDDTAPQAAEPTPVDTVTEDAVAADSADVDDIDDVMFEEDDSADEDAFEVEFEQFEAEADEVSEPPSFEEMLGAARAVVAAPRAEEAEEIVEEVFPESVIEDTAPEPEPEPEIELEPEPAAPAPVAASVEEDMAATARYQQTVLTDDQTADAAAGALGKLISKMDLGSDNTLEGLVREMLKPMMKEWLDANLPKIVDEKVEAEVQRIARMAR